jgi:phosphoenolpyruvate synthase/pyruvate phosphate dikinase
LSFSSEEELHLYELSTKAKKEKDDLFLSEEIISDIRKLVDKYYWIPFGYDGPLLYDEEHYKRAIRDLVENKTEKEIADRIVTLRTYQQLMEEKQQTLIKRYGITEPLERLVKSMHTLARMTDERKKAGFQAHIAFDKLIGILAEKMSLAKMEIKYLQLAEIRKHVDDPKYLSTLAKKRLAEPIIMVWKAGVGKFLPDEKVREISSILFEAADEEALIIKGSVGSKGETSVVQGKVVILHVPEEIQRLREGDVLVTGMTTPEFVPAMRKSIAVVTDEGGVTCHAAIVARELKKPCIIGTKNATKILKDGDLVEVDAEKGIVRILERK